MALKYWWLLPVGLAAVAAVAWMMWRRPGRLSDAVPVAHADRLTALPAYQNALAAHKRWLAVGVASSLLLALCLLAAAARPVAESTSVPELLNRDIMLCLDVSGSMTGTDQAIVAVFAELATSFKGERIGLTIFDSSAVMVFPLTDDYDFVGEQLATAKAALAKDATSYDFFQGTYEVPGSSLIGDGLASCVGAFPRDDTSIRSRSIILATDNELAGKPLFTLGEAATTAKNAKVRVHAINPNDYSTAGYTDGASKELRDAAAGTGGSYNALGSASTVKSIVRTVQATEAARLKGAPMKTLTEQPALPLAVGLLALLGLTAAAWKVRQ
ncbi:MAG: VWA domain-containing protein [Specibacter sp.]